MERNVDVIFIKLSQLCVFVVVFFDKKQDGQTRGTQNI